MWSSGRGGSWEGPITARQLGGLTNRVVRVMHALHVSGMGKARGVSVDNVCEGDDLDFDR